jgi:hypothetical protein
LGLEKLRWVWRTPVRVWRYRFGQSVSAFLWALLLDDVYKNPLSPSTSLATPSCLLPSPQLILLLSRLPCEAPGPASPQIQSHFWPYFPLCLPCYTAPASATQLLSSQNRIVQSTFCPFRRHISSLLFSPLLYSLTIQFLVAILSTRLTLVIAQRSDARNPGYRATAVIFALATAQYCPRSRQYLSYAPSGKS